MEAMDFQKATSERILKLFDMGQPRVLLADEVGLGKTIIAREVVTALIQKHRDMDKKFKVVYVCSNINIASQNCRKLGIKVSGKALKDITNSRLSMQLLCLREQDQDNEQLIPLTPATSFTMKGNSAGKGTERALIYCLLVKHPYYSQYNDRLFCLLKGKLKDKSWTDAICEMNKRIDIVSRKDKKFIKDFCTAFNYYLKEDKMFSKTFKQICKSETPSDDQLKNIIRKLRIIFAKISLKTLNPDLVIMDEFQRFKELIDIDDDKKEENKKELTEQQLLAREFLNEDNIKVLLLSATPYKPYSTLEELCSGTDGDHYSEFKHVMRFLYSNSEEREAFEKNWDKYSEHFYEIRNEALTELKALKKDAEESLYKVICRTERRNERITDTSKAIALKENLFGDIKSFFELQKVMDKFELGKFPVEYAKSAPYLLSFMTYKVRDSIMDAINAKRKKKSIFTDSMCLKKSDLDAYKQIPVNNARLNTLYKEAFGTQIRGAEYLLWIPASKPYYDAKNTKAGKVFYDNRGYTKTLIFSRWEMVPRVISGLTSYEAERLVMKKLPASQKLHYYADDASSKKRKGVHQLITSENSDLLKYPCITLAKLYDPVDYLDETIGIIRYRIRKKVDKLLTQIKKKYYFDTVKKSAANIYNFLRDLDGIHHSPDGRFKIPNGIEEILVDIAIGSPAVCAYRIFNNTLCSERIASKFIVLFNKTETVSILHALYGSKGNYYEQVLKYCCEGNIQAVLDEYAFVLNDQGITLCEQMESGFIATAKTNIKTEESLTNPKKKPDYLRTHFAVGYYNAKISDESIQRTENIRKAFNSPFRPFVLATTSIGQEGLDFHLYSRKIMHWNLPSNPIDIEQREGRVNRFMCHAIRQNLADNSDLQKGFIKGTSIWKTIIDNAKVLKGNNSDLVPYWCLPEDYTPTKRIERIVPMFPYSSDIAKYKRLIDILSMYRLTLGQPRQEELLDTINNADLPKAELNSLYMNLSPWSRPDKEY